MDEPVPGLAAVVDEIVVGVEDAVRQPVVTHELPDVLDRVQLVAFRRKRHQRDVGRHDEMAGQVPTSLIEEENGMLAGRNFSVAISARCRVIASVSQRGRTSAAALPACGQIAPKI